MNQTIADRIIQRYRTCSRSPFPTDEIAKVVPNDAETRSLFHARVELFLSGIAGYASSADRLKRRGSEALQKARVFLSEGFFEKYREYAPFKLASMHERHPLCPSNWKQPNLIVWTSWRKSAEYWSPQAVRLQHVANISRACNSPAATVREAQKHRRNDQLY